VRSGSLDCGTTYLYSSNIFPCTLLQHRTLHHSTAYGLGPNPCSPFYIFYPGRHPADSMIQSPPAEPSSPGAEKFNTLSKKLWKNIKGLGGQASSLYNPATKNSNTPEFFSDDMSHQSKSAPIRPNLIQSFLDRKDFSTRQSSTVACIRFYEEFIEWRLLPPISEKPSKNGAGVSSSGDSSQGKEEEKEKHIYLAPIAYPLPRSATLDSINSTDNSFKKSMSIKSLKQKARLGSQPTSPTSTRFEPVIPPEGEAENLSTSTPRDIPAARIYLNPTLHPIIPSSCSGRSLAELFTGKEGGELGREPVYTTLEELGSVESQPIHVFFSDTGPGTKTYWWVSEDSSWRIVYDKTQDVNISSKRHSPFPPTTATATATTTTTTTPPNQHDGKPTLDASTHNFIFGKPKAEEKVTKMFPEVKGGCVKVFFHHFHPGHGMATRFEITILILAPPRAKKVIHCQLRRASGAGSPPHRADVGPETSHAGNHRHRHNHHLLGRQSRTPH